MTRAALVGLIVVFAAMLVEQILVGGVRGHPIWLEAGHDYETYMAATSRWLAGGGFFDAYQLAGPYQVVEREILYPPVALLLFAPFTFLPAIAWWVLPLGIIGWVVASHRPSLAGWVVILLLLSQPVTYGLSWSMHMVSNGNPAIWAAAFVALATRWPFFGPFALLKPAPLLAPFGLIGIRSRWWWAGLATLGLGSLLFLPMWPDYLRVLANARTPGSPVLYALATLPLMLVPVVASALSTNDVYEVAAGDASRTTGSSDRHLVDGERLGV